MSLQKRRHPSASASPSPPPAHLRQPSPPPHADLYLEAHEASLIRGHDRLAKETESREGRMMRWSGEGSEDVKGEIWVDRYDALNLLTSLPRPLPSAPSAPPSPTLSIGFSDLPSDSEEMFYFDLAERDEITRKKKRRKMEEGRLERIKRLEEEENEGREEEPVEETEPSETQLALMRKLHTTLSAAAQPSLLEMRILANHGADPRFAFLRKGGKWSDEWAIIRRGGKVESEKRKEEAEKKLEEVEKSATGGLVGYGSDLEDESEQEGDGAQVAGPSSTPDVSETAVDVKEVDPPAPEEPEETAEERAKKEAKAEKAREWARKRKAAREGAVTE